MGIRYTLFFSVWLGVLFGAQAQELPNLPPSIKWQQIKSGHFKIIYPKGLGEEAQRTANILENIYGPASRSLNARPRKFPVILQNQYAVSNGFVTIAPYRSEFYMFDPQNYRQQGNDRWLERLAVHEYRHIVQFEKAVTPVSKALFFLTGEIGPFLAAGAAVPWWFFEGDAVGAETAFARTGRGRMPSFLMAFKANLIEKGGFNYYKQYLKSYRDLVPNHYVTGYLMTTYLKNKSGADVWGRIVGRAFARPYIPFTFSNAMKKETGKRLVPTYKEMIEQQKQLYAKQITQITPTEFTTLPHGKRKRFTNYYFPRHVYGNRVLAIKDGFSDIPSLVLIGPDGSEKTIHKLGAWQNPGSLSANDSTAVWAEMELDPRWQMRTYSVIKKLDLATKELTRLTKKSKYLAPAISNNGKWIAAIHQSVDGKNGLHLLDARTGELIKAFENRNNDRYSTPRFGPKDENLVLLKNVGNGKAITLKNIATEKEQALYFSDTENLGTPAINGEWLFYATDHNGIDNIYAMNTESRARYQVTSSKYGAFSPTPSGQSRILYNEYTADGFEMASATISPSAWTAAGDVKHVGTGFHRQMVAQEGVAGTLYDYPDSLYKTSRYRKLGHTVRPYRWGLVTGGRSSYYALEAGSKDLLQTTALSAKAIYNHNLKAWSFVAGGSYQALYPIIDASFGHSRYGNSIAIGLRLPLQFTDSKYERKASIGIGTQYIALHRQEAIPAPASKRKLIAIKYKTSLRRMLKKSPLDLDSRWGQTLKAEYGQTPFSRSYQSKQFSTETNLYFPGAFAHHSFRLAGTYQFNEKPRNILSSPISFTRGFHYRPYSHFLNLSLNYKLPLLYMDWHLGPVLNLRRAYANVFYDHGLAIRAHGKSAALKSFGAEVSLQFNLFRLLPLIDMGIRYSYLPDFGTRAVEIIFGNVSF